MRDGAEEVDGDWWPASYEEAQLMADLTGEHIVLGRYVDGADRFHLATVGVLVTGDDLDDLLVSKPSFSASIMSVSEPDRLSNEPMETHWSIQMPSVDVEPIVVKWERGQRAMVVPDQRFHATYGFTPVHARSDGSVTYMWPDDLDRDALRVGGGAEIQGFGEPSKGDASVSARRRFVEDYCTLRQRHLVVLYFIHAHIEIAEAIDQFLGDSEGWVDIERPGRRVSMCRLRYGDTETAKVEIWGLAGPIVSPGRLTVSNWDWDYSDLDWPSGTGHVHTTGHVDNVFVTDQALERFMVDPDVDVNMVHGSATRGYQWGISTHGRVGRDLVAIDLKRLNEGVPRAIAAHMHRFAVAKPNAADQGKTNIAARTVRLVSGLQRLGRALEQLQPGLGLYVSQEIVAADLNGDSWPDRLQNTAAPAALEMAEAEFLSRGATLNDAVIDPLAQKALRRLVEHLAPVLAGTDAVKESKSIALLNIIVLAAAEADEAGLDPIPFN